MFRYAVMPQSRAALDQRVLLEAELESFNVPLLPIRRKNDGPLPMANSLLRLESGRLTMSAFKQSEDGAAFILRFYNSGTEACEETVHFARPVRRVELARLDETPVRVLDVDAEGAMRCSVPPSGIVSLRIVFDA
jgi:alpha-mannosidase